jgi:hypothetical protein
MANVQSSFVFAGTLFAFEDMNDSYLTQYLRMRLLVGFLGERSQFAWWPTSFFGTSSEMFLEPVFPKTTKLAQYHGVTEAARRVHDEHIGVGNVFHLFRLPEEAEQGLHSAMINGRKDSVLFTSLGERDAALGALSDFASGARDITEGPTSVGVVKNVFTAQALNTLAQSYLAAFDSGIRTYPYFMA